MNQSLSRSKLVPSPSDISSQEHHVLPLALSDCCSDPSTSPSCHKKPWTL